MSFQTGLSGLNASSKSLDVIGNNIANANTVGMKSSRTEFADLVASTLGTSGGGTGAGIGVSVATIAQQFSQGNISITGNSLDVAINGGGFFQVTQPDGSLAYTRDGQFKMDKNGYITTNTGANVMGYPTDVLGNATSITTQKMVVPTGAPIAAQATSNITAEFNLDARAKIASTVVPPTPLTTYGTSVTVFDSQGVAIPVNLYFTKVTPATAGTDQWDVYDSTPTKVGALIFNASGALTGTTNGAGVPTALGQIPLTITPTAPSIVPPFPVTANVSKATEYGAAFNVSNLTQDGYTSGELVGVNIDPSGVITTRYSNGQTQARGKIALADFRNVQGLAPVGSGTYLETFASGQSVLGSAGIGKFGELRSGALEESNVDLTGELVNMMTAQRNYQANAQTIKTQDQIMSTLVNLR
ncbi:MAG: flagellar hook protein FlgE [Rhodoferax sp.]